MQDKNPMASAMGEKSKIEQARILCSHELFQGRREVFIRHCDHQYRLQITKAGKLILNK